jgi:hypothetical protein
MNICSLSKAGLAPRRGASLIPLVRLRFLQDLTGRHIMLEGQGAEPVLASLAPTPVNFLSSEADLLIVVDPG